MKKITILTLLISSTFTFSQVGIGTTIPDASAILDVSSNDKGILVPRISLIDVTNLVSPVNAPTTGLMIWNTNASVIGGTGIGFYFFDGTKWVAVNTNTSNTLDGAYDAGGSGAGRTIIADANPVKITGTDGFWVTGTHGSGASLEASTTNSKMFYYPRKSAFRAGFDDTSKWIDANIGNYSAAFGRNTLASGNYSLAVGELTTASGDYSTSFGTFTTASGSASTAFGNTTTASGVNSFTAGVNSVASGSNSFAAGSNVVARSFGEVAFGIFNTDYTPSSATAIVAGDRVFSVGYGTGSGSRKDAIEIFKTGRVKINNLYNLPLTDGTANQVIVTDGAGNLTWENQVNNSNITVIPIYAGSVSQVVNTTSFSTFANITGCRSSIVPSLFNATGNIQVRLFVRYLSSSGTVTDNYIRLIANDGPANPNNTIISETDSWTDTPTGTGGVYKSGWVNWNANLNPQQIHLRAQSNNGSSLTIANVYLMVKTQ